MIIFDLDIKCSCGNIFILPFFIGDTSSSIGLPIYFKRMNCNKCNRYHEVECFRTLDGYKIYHSEESNEI